MKKRKKHAILLSLSYQINAASNKEEKMIAWTKDKFRKYPDLKEFVLYALFGILTTGANIGTFMGLRYLAVPTVIANAAAWLTSVFVAYVTNRKWVFHSAASNVIREFCTFAFYRLMTGILDEVIVVVLVEMTGSPFATIPDKLWELAVKVISNIIVIILNYIFSKKRIFSS